MIADHDELESLIAAYTLGVADAQEVAAVRAHLSECSSCRELAARLQSSVDALPLAAPAVNPTAGLRDRILSAAGAATSPRPEHPPARGPSPPQSGLPPSFWGALSVMGSPRMPGRHRHPRLITYSPVLAPWQGPAVRSPIYAVRA